ncbi:RNA-binding protein 42 [Agrilus planipennis]|uniref:RNA-binding protein 42 n=1 Tax=Agrilus planipennis TaxID=224129 RepID=A0A1W4XJQ7_AGRPL|nr:RNA-binding protein 42 [Agrilus planipennis]
MDRSGDKFRKMEDEMSRFEAEISGLPMSGAVSFNPGYPTLNLPGFGHIPPPPAPPMMIPQQVKGTIRRINDAPQPAVVSAKPTLYTPTKTIQQPQQQPIMQSQVDFMALQSEVDKKLKKLKEKVSVPAEQAISQGKASSAFQSFGPDDYKRRGKNKKLLRTAGGQVWEDPTLTDWSEDDFRIFCGDLGNDVTDELLTRTFNKYPSFVKARVVRDKRTNKSRGYGFVSFKDPSDFTKAMKEMNGRYVGSRPIKLRKSNWKNRCVDTVRKKEKERAALINMLTAGSTK